MEWLCLKTTNNLCNFDLQDVTLCSFRKNGDSHSFKMGLHISALPLLPRSSFQGPVNHKKSWFGVRTTIDSSSRFEGAIERVEWSPILWNYTQNENIEFIWQRNDGNMKMCFLNAACQNDLVFVFLMQLSPLCQTSFTVHLSCDSHHPPPAWWLWEQLRHW